MPHELAGGSNRGLRSYRMAVSRLNHGTVQNLILNPLIKKCCHFNFRTKVMDTSDGIYSGFYKISPSHILVKNILNKWSGEKENTKICALWGLYAAQNGCFLPTFRDHISIQFSRIKQSKKKHTRYEIRLRTFPGFENNLKKKKGFQAYISDLPTKQLEMVANRDLPILPREKHNCLGLV